MVILISYSLAYLSSLMWYLHLFFQWFDLFCFLRQSFLYLLSDEQSDTCTGRGGSQFIALILPRYSKLFMVLVMLTSYRTGIDLGNCSTDANWNVDAINVQCRSLAWMSRKPWSSDLNHHCVGRVTKTYIMRHCYVSSDKQNTPFRWASRKPAWGFQILICT